MQHQGLNAAIPSRRPFMSLVSLPALGALQSCSPRKMARLRVQLPVENFFRRTVKHGTRTLFDDREDRRCMSAIARHDRAAFDHLFWTYEQALGRFLLRLVGDVGSAEDCLQETFLRLWQAAPNWRGQGKVSTYVFQIAKRAGLNALERRRRQRQISDSNLITNYTGEHEPAGPQAGPADAAAGSERQALVRQAVAELPPEEQVLIHLLQVEGLTYREVAQILTVPASTIKSRMGRILERLRRRLQRFV